MMPHPWILGSAFILLVIVCLVVIWVIRRRSSSSADFARPEGHTGPSQGALVIVEPRAHPNLKRVMHAFHAKVPADWTLYVVHGTTNETYAKEAATDLMPHRRVVFIRLNTSNLNPSQYNALFKTPEFWDQIDAEHILVFQTDTMPCGPALDMERYKKFGYVGCAYGNLAGPNTYWTPYSFYGCGGLSLRRKSFMKACLAKRPRGTDPDEEDVTFSTCVDDLAAQFPIPSVEDLGDFCAQQTWGGTDKPPKSFGAHQLSKNMFGETLGTFLEYCPAASIT